MGCRPTSPRLDPKQHVLIEAAPSAMTMLLRVHDELVFEAPADRAEAAMTVIRRVMETADEPAVKLSVQLVVDARAAGNWDEAH